MSWVLGVDARGRGDFLVVHIEDGRFRHVESLDGFAEVFEAAEDADAIAFDIPIGHEDPTGEHGGQRACERAALDLMGEDVADRLLAYPPPIVFEQESAYPSARRRCEDEGWPALAKPIFFASERLAELEGIASGDGRVIEIHPELSFTVLNEKLGNEGPLEHYGEGWAAANERLEALQAVGFSPEAKLDEADAHPKTVLDAAIAAWSAERFERGEARVFPKDPPVDPRTGREVALYA